MSDADYSKEYVIEINRVVRLAFTNWKINDPMKIKPDHIRTHLRQWPEGSNRTQHRILLNGYLTFCGNYVIRGMRWRDPIDARIRVRWLTPAQVETLLSLDLDPKEEIVIRLALDMGLRRAEIGRILLSDLTPGFLTVRGKGKKLRSVPYPPDFQICLDRWLQYRDGLLERFPGNDPENLIIVIYRGHLCGISRSALNKIYVRLSEKTGFHFSYHDLRRTWARTAWEIGIPIETIGLILGHHDTKTTLQYIGVNADHTLDAMRKIHFAKLEKQGGTKNGRKNEEINGEPDIEN